jgi:hypothetical protein
VLGTGIALILAGPDHRDPWLGLHKVSFVIWFGAMIIHVLGHILDAGATTWRELHDPAATATARRRRWRTLAVALSLVAGVGLASGLWPSAHAWTTGHLRDFHHDH